MAGDVLPVQCCVTPRRRRHLLWWACVVALSVQLCVPCVVGAEVAVRFEPPRPMVGQEFTTVFSGLAHGTEVFVSRTPTCSEALSLGGGGGGLVFLEDSPGLTVTIRSELVRVNSLEPHEVPLLFWCAKGSDGPLATVRLEAPGTRAATSPPLSSDVLHVNEVATLNVGGSLGRRRAKPKLKFVPEESSCSEDGADSDSVVDPLFVAENGTMLVVFKRAGRWLMCLSEDGGGVYQRVYTVTVHDVPAAPTAGISESVPTGDDDGLGRSVPEVKDIVAGTANADGDAGCETRTSMLEGRTDAVVKSTVPGLVILNQLSRVTFNGVSASEVAGLTVSFYQGPGCVLANRVYSSTMKVDSEGTPYCTVKPTMSLYADYTRFSVCVELATGTTQLGSVLAFQELDMQVTPTVALRDGVARVTFGGASLGVAMPRRFVVVGDDVDCGDSLEEASVYASGVVGMDGSTELFATPSTSSDVAKVKLCLTRNSSRSAKGSEYFYGGVVSLSTLTVLSSAVVRARRSSLRVWPAMDDCNLFLVPWSGGVYSAEAGKPVCEAAAERLYASDMEALPKSGGVVVHVVCAASYDGTVVGAANTTVSVAEPWEDVIGDSSTAVKLYVPFTVTLREAQGTLQLPTSCEFVVQPARIACGEDAGAEATETFLLTNGVANVTLTSAWLVPSARFCVRLSPSTAVDVLTTVVEHYVTPSGVVAGVPTSFTSSGMMNGMSGLSSTEDCRSLLGSSSVASWASTLEVPGCDVERAYYCESSDAGATYESRGEIAVLRAETCGSTSVSASIVPVTVAPGKRIADYGIGTFYLVDPFLSRNADCTDTVPGGVGEYGYSPSWDEENVTFYVCCRAVDNTSLVFTTSAPTLRVGVWSVSPKAVVGRYNATLGKRRTVQLTLNHEAPSRLVYISFSEDCSDRAMKVGALGSSWKSATVSLFGVSGMAFVCAFDHATGRMVAASRFLVVTEPNVLSAPHAIASGGVLSVALEAPSVNGKPPLYSLRERDDANSVYAEFFTTAARIAFPSWDECGRILEGTASKGLSSNATVAFNFTGVLEDVNSVVVCASTPCGIFVAVGDLPVVKVGVYPSRLVTGMTAAVLAPQYTHAALQMVRGSGCDGAERLPEFATDDAGYGMVEVGTAAPTGAYSVCDVSGGVGATAVAVGTVEVVAPLSFEVERGEVTVGLRRTLELLGDLRVEYLLEGFGLDRECHNVTGAYGTWDAVSETSIRVAASSVVPGGGSVHLCALDPVSGVVVGVASSGDGVVFVQPSAQVPADGVETCVAVQIAHCEYPGDATVTDGVLGVVYGDCESAAGRARNVGQTAMGGGGCVLRVDAAAVSAYPAGAPFSLCAWRSGSLSDYVALGEVSVRVTTTSCPSAPEEGQGSRAWVTAVIVVCALVGLCVLGGGVYVLWRWCIQPRWTRSKSVGSTRGSAQSTAAPSGVGMVEFAVPGSAASANPLSANGLKGGGCRTFTVSPELAKATLGPVPHEQDPVALETEARGVLLLTEMLARYSLLRTAHSEQDQLRAACGFPPLVNVAGLLGDGVSMMTSESEEDRRLTERSRKETMHYIEPPSMT